VKCYGGAVLHRTLFVSAFSVAVVACGGSQEPAPAAPAPAAAASAAPTPSAAPAASAAPAGSGSASPASADLSPIIEEAIGRVQGLTADPSDAAIQATFSPKFLAVVPAEKVKSTFTGMHCTQHTAVKVKDETTAIVRLQCEKGTFNAAIIVNPAPPHLIEGLLLKPAS
jgi:hypothetical protein